MKLVEVTGVSVNEVSTELLARYKTAAGKQASAADAAGDYKKGDKRFSGIVKATKKQFDNDAKTKSVSEDSDETDFADELYQALEDRYPLLVAKAGHHAVGNAIMSFMHYEGQVQPSALVSELARAVKSSLTSVEY